MTTGQELTTCPENQEKGMTSNNNHDSQTDIRRVMLKKCCCYYHHHAQVIKWDILFWTPFGQGLESVHQIWCRYIKVLLRLGSFGSFTNDFDWLLWTNAFKNPCDYFYESLSADHLTKVLQIGKGLFME